MIAFRWAKKISVHLVDNAKYEWGKAQVLADGKDVVIVACGPLVGRAIEAGRLLKEKGVSATVISNPFINRVDLETIGSAVKTCSGRIVTIEDHQVICGMGAQLAHALSQAGIAHRMRLLRLSGREFGRSAYVAEDLYQHTGLTAAGLVEQLGLIKQADAAFRGAVVA